MPALETLPAETVAVPTVKPNEPVPDVVMALVTAIAPVVPTAKLPPEGMVKAANGVPVVAPPVCVIVWAIITVLFASGKVPPNQFEAVLIAPVPVVI